MSTGVANTLTFRLLEESDSMPFTISSHVHMNFHGLMPSSVGVQPFPIGFGLVFKDQSVHICQAFLSITLDEAHILNVSVDLASRAKVLAVRCLII